MRTQTATDRLLKYYDMKLLLKRIALKRTYTIGRLYIDGKYFCDTLEPQVRDLNHNGFFDNGEKKVAGKTAIPYGTYKVTLTLSPRFGRILPLLHDVKEFVGVRIHSGNTDVQHLSIENETQKTLQQ